MQTFSFTGVAENEIKAYYISTNLILLWKHYKNFKFIVAPVLAQNIRRLIRIVLAGVNSSFSCSL